VDRAGQAGGAAPEALRVHALPAPGIGAHRIQVARGLPAQQGACQAGVRVAGVDVARAARDDLVGHRAAAGALVGADHLQHAVAAAGAQVDRERLLPLEQVAQRRHVSFGEVHHVDVVAHAGAVGRVVVAAEHLHLGPLADRHLRDVGHQVVRHPARVLADQAAFVRAHRVEVAQAGDLPARVGLLQVVQDALAHQLGRAVGVGRRQRRILADRQRPGLAVHRGRRAEHQPVHAEGDHGLAHREQAAQVVAVVHERLRGRFAHRLVGREVDHRVDAVLLEHRAQRGRVAHVEAVEHRGPARQACQPVQHFGRAVGEVVGADDVISGFLQRQPGVGSDVAGGPGQQDGGHGMQWSWWWVSSA